MTFVMTPFVNAYVINTTPMMIFRVMKKMKDWIFDDLLDIEPKVFFGVMGILLFNIFVRFGLVFVVFLVVLGVGIFIRNTLYFMVY